MIIPTTRRGFTLIETMVAVSLLSVAIVSPMSLATQSLASAYYARDQITAFYMAQEAIETVRAVRDGNILQNSQGTTVNLLAGIPDTTGQPFRVDTRTNTMTLCQSDPGGVCIPLQTDGTLYGYDPTWKSSNFTRTVTANFVAGTTDEVKITAVVSWRTGSYQTRSFTLSEDLYRWVNDGSAAQ